MTKQNYEEFQVLYKDYAEKGLEILGFPCNNFGSQEPGTNAEIQASVKKYGVTFPLLGKVDCENGAKTHPLFWYLRSSLPNGIFGFAIKWNFSKWLCDENGVPIKRYSPSDSPFSIEKDIAKMLGVEKDYVPRNEGKQKVSS